jgi:hypothetical protein
MDPPEIQCFHRRALTREGRTVPAYGQRYPKVRRNLEEAVGTAKILNANKRLGTAVDKKIAATAAVGGRFAKDGVLHVADLLADRVGEEVALHLQDGVGADLRLRLDGAVTQARLISYNIRAGGNKETRDQSWPTNNALVCTESKSQGADSHPPSSTCSEDR